MLIDDFWRVFLLNLNGSVKNAALDGGKLGGVFRVVVANFAFLSAYGLLGFEDGTGWEADDRPK